MAKCSDIQSIPNLAAEFEELREMIEELGTSDFASGPIEAVLAWLGKPGQDDDNWGTLWGRRQQFCPRFTHSRFTWGADSSGRCESINSVLKNPFNSLVHGKMRLLQLLPSNVLDQRFQDRARATPPPIIADMKTRIGVSAKRLEVVTLTAARLFSCALTCGLGMRARLPARQVSKLRADESAAGGRAAGRRLPEQPEYYYVYHSGGSGSTDAADETASITPAELVCLDVGLETSLEDTHTRHIDSVDTCTCQWLAHFGLPCVHLLRLWFYLQLNRVPNGV
ncbi:hypothetical protein T492DRAFT_869338, partial [Pavlovales sp. CCMP2436]